MVSYLWPLAVGGCQRPYSIRTRIKTLKSIGFEELHSAVRDHIPLEQGLRLLRRSLRMPSHIVRDHIPLEQGLRHVPLLLTEHSAIGVRDHIPLEQGLRHNPTLSRYCYHSCQRPYSIRTRIKTDVN